MSPEEAPKLEVSRGLTVADIGVPNEFIGWDPFRPPRRPSLLRRLLHAFRETAPVLTVPRFWEQRVPPELRWQRDYSARKVRQFASDVTHLGRKWAELRDRWLEDTADRVIDGEIAAEFGGFVVSLGNSAPVLPETKELVLANQAFFYVAAASGYLIGQAEEGAGYRMDQRVNERTQAARYHLSKALADKLLPLEIDLDHLEGAKKTKTVAELAEITCYLCDCGYFIYRLGTPGWLFIWKHS